MEDKYIVIAEKYTGKHRVYTKGQEIPASEVFGDIDVLLNGQKDLTVERNGKEVKLPDVAAKLKKVSAATNKKVVAKKDDKDGGK